MLAITADLLHGTIRAGSPDDTVMAGGAAGEWPPSPARLFSALVAGDGTRSRCSMTEGTELLWLESLAPPIIHASPSHHVLVSPLRARYAVVDGTAEGAVHDYPGRTSREVRPGVRQAPKCRTVIYVWPDAVAPGGTLAALRARAARVGYLGCADSPVRLSVRESVADGLSEPWRPDPGAQFTLPVPYRGFLAALDDAYDTWSSGNAMRRAWIRTERAGYQAPGCRAVDDGPAPTVIWLRLGRAVAGHKLVALTETLRDAVLDHVQRLLPPGADMPSLLHGHRQPGEVGPQARFLALPDVGYERSDGRLLGAAIWLPPATEPEVVQVVRSALARLAGERLVKPRWFDIAVAVHTGEPRPWAANPDRWTGPAASWTSATPVVHERWTKGLPTVVEVARWCAHADLPAPASVSFRRHPALLGAPDLRPDQVFRPGRDRRPYSHMRIDFSDRVAGPVVIGGGRQLGLGLMAPVHEGGGEHRA